MTNSAPHNNVGPMVQQPAPKSWPKAERVLWAAIGTAETEAERAQLRYQLGCLQSDRLNRR